MGVLAGLPTTCYLAANTMADTKGANISRMVLKQAGRAKEKILQNLGKSDKTTDEIFEEHLMNFNTQQVNSTRLHKDINNYLRCIRAMQTLFAAEEVFHSETAKVYSELEGVVDKLAKEAQRGT